MRRSVILLLLFALGACSAAPAPAKHPLLSGGQKGCDDGGSGGVVIDGVCL